MPMQAWIDDSGAKGQGGCITLAGLIGEAEDWTLFSERWAMELAREPKLRFLSTSDAATRTSEFHHWPISRRDAKVRRLVRVARDFPFTVVSVSVDLADYAAFAEAKLKLPVPAKAPEAKRIRTFTEQPYFFCIHSICSAICIELCQRGVTDQIEIFFDEQEIMKPRIQEWYPLYLSGLEPNERAMMPSELFFRDDKEFMPLQIADFVAWIERANNSGLSHPFRRITKELKTATRSRYCRMWNREAFEGLISYEKAGAGRTENTDVYKQKLRDYFGMPNTKARDNL